MMIELSKHNKPWLPSRADGEDLDTEFILYVYVGKHWSRVFSSSFLDTVLDIKKKNEELNPDGIKQKIMKKTTILENI